MSHTQPLMWSNKDSLRHALDASLRHASDEYLPLDFIDLAIARFSSHCAFQSGDKSVTYQQVDQYASAFAAFLQNVCGVAKNEAIAVMLPNSIAFPVACIGILRTGAFQVNVNPKYTPRELEYQINDSGATTLVIFEDVLQTYLEIAPKTRIKNIIIVPTSANDGPAKYTTDSQTPNGKTRIYDFQYTLDLGRTFNCNRPNISGDDIMFLQYTGGTTGVSKGAILTHRNLASNILQFHDHIAGTLQEGEEVIITALPLYHIFALTVNFLSSFVIGARNILISDPSDLSGLVKAIKHSGFSVITGVNTLFDALISHPEFKQTDFSKYRFAVGGGTAIRASTSDNWQAITGHPIRVGYGLSETSPLVSMQKVAPGPFRGDVGMPAAATSILIVDDKDEPAAEGEPGELCVRGPQVTEGYWKKPDANKEAFNGAGYFRTGDIAVSNSDGTIEIVDRKKDMILVSGFNVFPNEIEAIVACHPNVAENVCVGVPDDRTGEAVKVFVVPQDGSQVTSKDLKEFCRQRLTGYKVPKHIEFRDSLPKTAVGKLMRRELRQEKN